MDSRLRGNDAKGEKLDDQLRCCEPAFAGMTSQTAPGRAKPGEFSNK